MCPTKDGQGRLPCSSWKVTQQEFFMAVEYYVMISDMSTGPRRRPQSCSRIRGMSGRSFSGLTDPVYASDNNHSPGASVSITRTMSREPSPTSSRLFQLLLPDCFFLETSSFRFCNNPKATNEHRHCCSSRSSSRRRRRLPSRRPTRPDWKTLRESIQRPSLLILGMLMLI